MIPGPSGASRRLAAEYSDAAAEYASCWAPVIGPMARVILPSLPLAVAGRVLDLGCGTGDLLPVLAGGAPAAWVLGVDRAPGMLAIARKRSGVPLALMAADELALGDATIDVAILAFVLHHLPDPAAALREVQRVLRTAGTLGIVVWGKHSDAPGAAIWQQVLDELGAGPDPRDPAVMRQAEMDSVEKLTDLLAACGFQTVRAWSEIHSFRWSARSLFELQTGCGLPARRLASLPADRQAECRARARARLEFLCADDLVYRPEVIYAVGEPIPAVPGSPHAC